MRKYDISIRPVHQLQDDVCDVLHILWREKVQRKIIFPETQTPAMIISEGRKKDHMKIASAFEKRELEKLLRDFKVRQSSLSKAETARKEIRDFFLRNF